MTVNPYSPLSCQWGPMRYDIFKYKENIRVVIESNSGPERGKQHLLMNNQHGFVQLKRAGKLNTGIVLHLKSRVTHHLNYSLSHSVKSVYKLLYFYCCSFISSVLWDLQVSVAGVF